MQNFATIQTLMNNGMDDEWTRNGQEPTHKQLATQKIYKLNKVRRKKL